MTWFTAADIRAASRLTEEEWAEYGLPAGETPDKLDPVAESANAYVEWVTGWKIDSTLPATLVPLVRDAVRMRAEQLVVGSQADILETAADFDMVQSFTAGSYSETRRDPSASANRTGAGMGLINPWPALNNLLWLLLGTTAQFPNADVDARYDYWRLMFGGPMPPSWQVVEVDWRTYDDSPWGYYSTTNNVGIEEWP